MPEPISEETRSDFINRCVPIVLEDNTATDNDQAVAICSSIYDESLKEYKKLSYKRDYK